MVADRNQQLQAYTGWLHTVARGMTATDLHDDLVQEGYIAMWRALGTFDPARGALDFWLKRAATDRMRSVVTGRQSMTSTVERKDTTGFTTGRGDATRQRIAAYLADHPAATGREIAAALGMAEGTVSYQRSKMGTVATAAALTPETVSAEALADAGWDLADLDATGTLDGVEVAYHAGEIAAALDALTPAQRRYVVARFWGGKTPAELRALFGYDPAALWRDAKPRLQARLANLRDLVTT